MYVSEALLTIRGSLLPGLRDKSDHAPSSVSFFPKSRPRTSKLSESVVRDPSFAKRVEDMWSKQGVDSNCPWNTLSCLKQVFKRVAKQIRSERRNSQGQVGVMLGVASKFHRAVLDNNIEIVRDCISIYNRLSNCYTVYLKVFYLRYYDTSRVPCCTVGLQQAPRNMSVICMRRC